MTEHTPPTEVDGTPVEAMDELTAYQGERWVTLVPPGEDSRLWEFSLDSGRIIQTRD